MPDSTICLERPCEQHNRCDECCPILSCDACGPCEHDGDPTVLQLPNAHANAPVQFLVCGACAGWANWFHEPGCGR